MGGGGAIGGCGKDGSVGRGGGGVTPVPVPGVGGGVCSAPDSSFCKVPIGGRAGGAEPRGFAAAPSPNRDPLAGANVGGG